MKLQKVCKTGGTFSLNLAHVDIGSIPPVAAKVIVDKEAFISSEAGLARELGVARALFTTIVRAEVGSIFSKAYF